MADGLPNERSIFEHMTIQDIYDEVCRVYKRYPQPWIIGYSGGKDSTATLQIVWKALEQLPPEERTKPVYVIASDTQVETPVIVDYINNIIRKVNKAAKEQDMPFHAEKVMPTLHNSFWVNLLGRGYPAPTTRFRWCTERMKIKPANQFIEDKVSQFGEVIVVLGVRKTESSTRMQLMNTYQVEDHALRRHTSLPGAYVYAPIADFSTDDVWTYLYQVPSPWGSNNRDLAALYRNANAGECPLVIDDTTPTCGNSRFGCWVCTVAERDQSMEAMIDNGEEWMQPLLEFRDQLSKTTDPDLKHEYRDIQGRDGRVIIKDDAPVARPYKAEYRKQLLKELLEAQRTVQEEGPNPDLALISEEELFEIRRIWRIELPDWEDSVPKIYREVYGSDLDWPADDDTPFGDEHQKLLDSICKEYDVPYDLVARMLEAEKRSHGMARRAGIQKALTSELKREWRSKEELMELFKEDPLQLQLV